MYYTSFPATPSTSNSNSIRAFCSKWLVDSFFLYFLKASIYNHVAKTNQGLKIKVPKNEVCFALKILDFHFFFNFFFFMVLHDVIFNVTTPMWMWNLWIFFKKCYKFQSVRVLSQDLNNKKNFSSLILINLMVGFAAMSAQLDLETICKRFKNYFDFKCNNNHLIGLI
jgi:hypothetical protein